MSGPPPPLQPSTSRPRFDRRFAGRLAATLAMAVVTALAFAWLRLPLPWTLGPLLATAIASMAGWPTASSLRLRNAAQAIVGTSLGLYFTRDVLVLLAGVWWLVAASIAWALALGFGFAVWLHHAMARRLPGTPRQLWATSWFSSAIGGANEMTLLAEREGARTDLVAAAHSLRVLTVAVAIPFGVTWLGLHGADATLPGPRRVDVGWLPVLLATTFGVAALVDRLGWTNPWFLGSLLPAMALTLAGVELSAIPGWMSNAAQVVVGVSLGVRFRRGFTRTAPAWLLVVLLGTLAMIVLCAGFAWVLARLSGLHVATLILGTAPGGITEMALTAKVLQLGVPVVTAVQLVRILAVLVLVRPLYAKLWGGRP